MLRQAALLSQKWATACSNRTQSCARDRAGDCAGSPMHWVAGWSVFSVRLIFGSLPSSFGVVVSGQCFCPSRSPRRAGSCEGRGTPLPLRAVVASLAAAARGMAAEVASGRKSVPRVEPRCDRPGAQGRRRADRMLRRAADASRSWRGGSHRRPVLPAGSATPSLGVVTCASLGQPIDGWCISRVVTTGWRRAVTTRLAQRIRRSDGRRRSAVPWRRDRGAPSFRSA